MRLLTRIKRRPLHKPDVRRASREHDEPVEAERDAARFRHLRQRGEEILIERIALAIDAFPLLHIRQEALALLACDGQFGKAVGEFDPACIELETFGDPWIVRLRSRKRRFRNRIFIKDRQPAKPEAWFDLISEHPAENIGPAIIGDHAKAEPHRCGGKRVTIIEECKKIDASVPAEGFGCRQPLRLGERIGCPLPVLKHERVRRAGRSPRERHAISHDRGVRLSRPVPLGHDELRSMKRPHLTVPENAGEIDDALLSRREQLFHGEFRRGVKITPYALPSGRHPFRCEAVEMRLIARGDLQRSSFYLYKLFFCKICPRASHDTIARKQKRTPAGVAVTIPEW
jgi:hypothetical protein